MPSSVLSVTLCCNLCVIPNKSHVLDAMQEILEKFEFFPIKCRIQRALEISKIRKEEESQWPNGQVLHEKIKVYMTRDYYGCLAKTDIVRYNSTHFLLQKLPG